MLGSRMKFSTSQKYIGEREHALYARAFREAYPFILLLKKREEREEHTFTGRESRGQIGVIENRG